jgi:hypothetical protein
MPYLKCPIKSKWNKHALTLTQNMKNIDKVIFVHKK